MHLVQYVYFLCGKESIISLLKHHRLKATVFKLINTNVYGPMKAYLYCDIYGRHLINFGPCFDIQRSPWSVEKLLWLWERKTSHLNVFALIMMVNTLVHLMSIASKSTCTMVRLF